VGLWYNVTGLRQVFRIDTWVFCIFILQLLNCGTESHSSNLNTHSRHSGRPFIWPHKGLNVISLCSLSEGFISDRILISGFVRGQCPFLPAHSLAYLREVYLNTQTVKFMPQKPIMFTSSYTTEANQPCGPPILEISGYYVFSCQGLKWTVFFFV
jgi:hypothetical protein